MKKFKVGTIVLGIISAIFMIALLAMIPKGTASAIIPISILLGIFLALTIYNLIMQQKSKKGEIKNKPVANVFGTLIDGLPVPASVKVRGSLYNDKIEFIATTGLKKKDYQHLFLEVEKIQRAMVLSQQQVKQIVSQSAPGMIIGAAAFGLLGAMVGGRVKTKEVHKFKYILLIEYKSDDEDKQIMLDVGEYSSQATTFVKKLQRIKPFDNQTVQL